MSLLGEPEASLSGGVCRHGQAWGRQLREGLRGAVGDCYSSYFTDVLRIGKTAHVGPNPHLPGVYPHSLSSTSQIAPQITHIQDRMSNENRLLQRVLGERLAHY